MQISKPSARGSGPKKLVNTTVTTTVDRKRGTKAIEVLTKILGLVLFKPRSFKLARVYLAKIRVIASKMTCTMGPTMIYIGKGRSNRICHDVNWKMPKPTMP